MGCNGSKNKKPKKDLKNRRRRDKEEKYKMRTGFTITKESVQNLSPSERDEYALFPDVDEYFEREELPKEMYVTLLKAIKDNKAKEYTNILQKYKISTMDLVVGLNDTVDFGNRKAINGLDLNPLHWAVYTNNLKATKAVIENQIFNIVIVGKVPTNTGMANDSEMSHEGTEASGRDGAMRRSHAKKDGNTHSEDRFGSIPRSLVLFWPIDQENYDIFNYLWNDLEINWGLKTLKFILVTICIKENQKLLGSFLQSATFENIVNFMPFHESMDFLEAFVIKNERIPEEMKTDLFDREEMMVYDFVGELM